MFKLREVCAILTVAEIILSDPLSSILSSLCSDFYQSHSAVKIDLKPLVPSVMSSTPGPHSMANAAEMKPAVVRHVISVPTGGGG